MASMNLTIPSFNDCLIKATVYVVVTTQCDTTEKNSQYKQNNMEQNHLSWTNQKPWFKALDVMQN